MIRLIRCHSLDSRALLVSYAARKGCALIVPSPTLLRPYSFARAGVSAGKME